MGIADFFRALFGGKPPGTDLAQEREVSFAPEPGAIDNQARRRVAVIALDPDISSWLGENVKPIVINARYAYADRPTAGQAADARVLIMEALPATDAKLHTKYDKIVRMKKGMGRKQDIMAIIAEKENYKRYPRGTYPGLLYFCVNLDDFSHRDPDIPPQGRDTVEGPHLHNFVDMPVVIGHKIKELGSTKVRN